MASNSRHWDDIEKAKALLRKRKRLLFRGLVLECCKRVVLLTPVDKGRARGNWQVTEGAPATEPLFQFDKSGTMVIQQALEATRTLSSDEVAFVVNNLPYIAALEEGHSQQAPAGMVAITMAQMQLLADEIMRSIRAEAAQISSLDAES